MDSSKIGWIVAALAVLVAGYFALTRDAVPPEGEAAQTTVDPGPQPTEPVNPDPTPSEEIKPKSPKDDPTLVVRCSLGESQMGAVFAALERALETPLRVLYTPVALDAGAPDTPSSAPADLFVARLAEELRPLRVAGSLAQAPTELRARIRPGLASPDTRVLPLAARSVHLLYAKERVPIQDLPTDITELGHERLKGRIGWIPSSVNFVGLCTTLREALGDVAGADALQEIARHEPRAVDRPKQLRDLLDSGAIDFALVMQPPALEESPELGSQPLHAAGAPLTLRSAVAARADSPRLPLAMRAMEVLLSEEIQIQLRDSGGVIPALETLNPPDGAPELKPFTVADGKGALDRDELGTLDWLRALGLRPPGEEAAP